MKKMMNQIIKTKRRAMIKGEMRMMGMREKHDQGGAEDDGDEEEAPPHPRVCHNVQRDHPVNNILGDIEKG
jgi:hypothetical protein